MQGLVAAGLGAALLPRLATDERRQETVVLELEPGLIAGRTVAVVWSRMQPRRADASAFVDAARAACDRVGSHETLLALGAWDLTSFKSGTLMKNGQVMSNCRAAKPRIAVERFGTMT